MRAFFLFVLLLIGALVVAAALTYPAWLLVSTISVEPVHRVMNRLAMLIALIGLIILTRRLGLSNRESLGYGLPAARFMAELLIGWIAGVLLMLPLVAFLLGLDIRQWRPEIEHHWLSLLLGGIVSGLAVALIEETFFRGVLFSAVQRTSGAAAAIVAPSLLYAMLHFLGGRLRVPPEEVGWEHGFLVLARLFERYAEPLAFIASLLALLVLGMLLALIRLRTGAIAACMGLHAAGVCTIAVLRKTTYVDASSEHAVWVGSYDGVIGWAALLWFIAIGAVYWKLTSQRSLPSSSS